MLPGDKLGTKICCPKDKKSKYKVCPSMFFRPIFLSLGKKTIPFSSYDDIRSTLQI